VLAEQLESRLANGEQIDITEHATLSSTLVRLAQRIGIDRVPRDVSPTLSEIAREIEDEKLNAEDAA
jgi:antitoxin (DNA-binding transcriptional repressor) of toxin-antitoxin stability system